MSFVRRHLTTVILSVLALAALVYVGVVDRGAVGTRELEARKKNLFAAWRKDDLSKVVLKTPSGSAELVRGKKNESGNRFWTVTIGGVTYAGEEQGIDKFLETLEYASYAREIPQGSVDRGEFGLDDPRSTVDVTMGDLSFHLAIGKAAPTKNEAYAEVPGRGVYAIPMGLVTALEIDPADLRSRTFVPYMSTELAELDLSGEGGDRAFVRGGWSGGRGSGFRVKAPNGDGVRVDGNVLDRVFVAFGKMQASAFIDDATADKVSSPKVTVTLVPREGPRAVFVVGGPCPSKKDQVVAVRREPTRLNVCIPQEALAPLLMPGSVFEDRALVGANADEVTEVRVIESKNGTERKLEIARSGAGFKMRAPADRSISGERGGAFLRGLLDARGDLLPTGTPPPEGTPTQVRILSQGGLSPTGETSERQEEVAIYPPKDDKSLVVRKEDGRTLLVPAAAARAFSVTDLLVRDLEITKLRASDIDEVSIDGGGKKQRFKREGSGLVLLEPKGKGFDIDLGFGMDLIERLAALKTTRWVAEQDDGAFGLGTPRFTIEITTHSSADAGPPTPVTLLIGARTDDGSYAKLASDPGVFLVPREIEERSAQWNLSRAGFLLPVSDIQKLKLAADDGQTLILARDGTALRIVGGKDKRSLDVAADVQQSLDDLVPIVAVSIGAAADHQGFKKPALTIECTTATSTVTFLIGSGDTFESTSVFYVRRSGIDATFVVPQSAVRPLLASVHGTNP